MSSYLFLYVASPQAPDVFASDLSAALELPVERTTDESMPFQCWFGEGPYLTDSWLTENVLYHNRAHKQLSSYRYQIAIGPPNRGEEEIRANWAWHLLERLKTGRGYPLLLVTSGGTILAGFDPDGSTTAPSAQIMSRYLQTDRPGRRLLDIFVASHHPGRDFVRRLGGMLDVRPTLPGDDSELLVCRFELHRQEYAVRRHRLASIDEHGLDFTAYPYYIRMLSRAHRPHQTQPETGDHPPDDHLRSIYDQLQASGKFGLMLVENLETRLQVFTPAAR